MHLRRRKVTIEIDHFKLCVEKNSPESPGNSSPDESVPGLTHSPSERSSSSGDGSQKQLLPPDEIA